MPEWTDELRTQVIKEYTDANPTPTTTTEIIKDIADNLGEGFTSNGVMAILVKAKVYMKKETATTTKKTEGSKRVNKADAINSLKDVIEALGLEPDDEIIGKLTGKAAVYFTGVIEKATSEEED